MAHLKTRETRQDPQSRYRWKLRLVRSLFERGYEREQIEHLFRFVDWLLYLPEKDLEIRFRDDLSQLEEEYAMPYITSIERLGIEKGREEGKQLGLQEGKQLGLQEGKQLGLQEGIAQGESAVLHRQLRRRFGPLPTWAEDRLARAGRGELESWADRVLDAESLEAVFA